MDTKENISQAMDNITPEGFDIQQMVTSVNELSSYRASELLKQKRTIGKMHIILTAFSIILNFLFARKGFRNKTYIYYPVFAHKFTSFLTGLKLLKLRNKL